MCSSVFQGFFSLLERKVKHLSISTLSVVRKAIWKYHTKKYFIMKGNA